MNDREFEDMNSDLAADSIHPQGQRQSYGAGYNHDSAHLNAANVKDRFLKALKEIAHLEKTLEDKNTLLAESAKEKDRLMHALTKAIEDKKKLYDRLADIEVVRNMEILEFKEGLEKQGREKDLLLRENNSLMNDLFKKDKLIDELRHELEKKDVHNRETETDFYTAVEKMRAVESKNKELEAKQNAGGQAGEYLKEMQDLIQQAGIEAEYQKRTLYQSKIEELNSMISDSETAADENATENTALKNEMPVSEEIEEEDEGGLGRQLTAEAVTAEKDDIGFRLREASEKETASPAEDKRGRELSADKRLVYSKSPIDRISGVKPPANMVYLAPSGIEGTKLKAIAIGAAVLIILGIAGVFLSGRF